MGQDRDENAARQRLRASYTSILLAIYKIKGYAEPGDNRLGQQVTEALAGASPADLRSPETVNAAIVGHLTQLAERAAEADRPRNIHGAEAARLQQMSEQGLAGALGHKGYGDVLRSRAEARAEQRSAREASGNAERTASSARFDGLGTTDWSSSKGLAITRAYANSSDMSWATKEPDLMRMGKPALQALHETHLKEDGYKALRDPAGMRFDNRTIVHGTGFMKRNKLDYNEAAKAADGVYRHQAMTDEEKKRWKGAIGDALKSNNAEEDAKARASIHDEGSRLKEAHPEMKPEVDRAMKKFGTDKDAGARAAAKARVDNETAASDTHRETISKSAAARKSSAALLALK